MKNKKKICAWMVFSGLFFMIPLGCYAQAQNNTGFSGDGGQRYALFGGSFDMNSKVNNIKVNGVFKIDSYTGKTWILKVVFKNGEKITRWVRVNETSRKNNSSNGGRILKDVSKKSSCK